MKRFQTVAAVSLAVGLFLSACSQTPAELKGGLEPQFGKAGSDWGTEVATNAAHPYVFAAGDYGPTEHQKDRVFLRSFNKNGSMRWEHLMPKFAEYSYAQDVVTDVTGNVYLTYSGDTNPDPFEHMNERYLVKFDKNGRQIWRKTLEPNTDGPLTVDGRGNIYVATNGYAPGLDKYAPSGKIIWQSGVQSDFSIRELAVSDKDELFVVGDDTSHYDLYTGQGYIRHVLRKYDLEYRLKFERRVSKDSNIEGMAIGGNVVYVAYGYEGSPGLPIYVNKYSTSGKLLLKRTLATGVEDYTGVRGVGADKAGNLYLAGFISSENPKSTNPYDPYEDNVFVSKYSTSLRALWTYSPKRLGSNEVAFDVSSRTPGEIYAVGRSNGRVNGSNKGSDDAFLLRLNAQGQKIWER